MRFGRLPLAVALVAVAALAIPATAGAGRLVATGHDVDNHCGAPTASEVGQCHFVKIAAEYVREGAPDPAKGMLLLECFGNVRQSIQNAMGAAAAAATTSMCPSTNPAFAAEPLSTTKYSAIIVGSSIDSLNRPGSDLNPAANPTTPDSDAINARAAAFATFFNEGGGIFAMSGDLNGDGNPANGPDTYYNFVPLPTQGRQVAPPFKLTQLGKDLGFHDLPNRIGTNNDINCCPTHNSFQEPPANGPVLVAERDSSRPPAPETLIAGGVIQNGQIVRETLPPASRVIRLPSRKRCVSRRKFRIRIRQPRGVKLVTAKVLVNGRQVRVLRRKRITAPVDLRGLPKGRWTVRIVVFTSNGSIITGKRKYRTCVPKRRGGRPRL